MLTAINEKSGHLGGTLLMLRSAGRRALNHQATLSTVVRIQGNLSLIGECFRILDTIDTIRDQHIAPVIEGAYEVLRKECGAEYEELRCDKGVLFMMTGGREFMQQLQGVNWSAMWPSIRAVRESMAFDEEAFVQAFDYHLSNGRLAADQLYRSVNAMKHVARLGHCAGAESPRRAGMETCRSAG
jgi:hypothetical protein